MLVNACINEIRRDLQRFHSSMHTGYLFSPRKSIFVKEKFIISSPQQKTASGCVKHKSVEKPNKKNRIQTLVLSQRMRSAIMTNRGKNDNGNIYRKSNYKIKKSCKKESAF